MNKFSLDQMQPVQEGFFSDLGKTISKLLSGPTVTEKLRAELMSARKEGRAYDVKFIKELLALRKKKPESLSDDEAGKLYLLMKVYIELPDVLKQAKRDNNIDNAVNGFSLWAQQKENRKLKDKLKYTEMERDNLRANQTGRYSTGSSSYGSGRNQFRF